MLPYPVGTTDIHAEQFNLQPEHRRRHLAAFGKSGVGKSTLLRNMITWDIWDGLGVTVIDPHGGLIDEVLKVIPKSRTNDVIYFDPQAKDHALGINVLESVAVDQRPLVVSSVVSVLKNIWSDNWGPRTEFILSNVVSALLSQPEPQTLVSIPKVLTNAEFRERIKENITDPAVEWFFDLYDNHWNARFREEAISPLLNKVNKFVTNPLLRDVIGQPRSGFDFRWLMDNKKILLCNLSKGALGEDTSSLLGSLIVTKLSLAALSRQDIPEEDRELHILTADEVQNFIYGVDFPTVLSEARKYRLSLQIATQTLSQLDSKSRAAVLGNCATIVTFRVSGEDAETLNTEFATKRPARLLQDLPDFKVYVKTLVTDEHGVSKPHEPELVEAFPSLDAPPDVNTPERVIKASLQRFARPRAEVEAKLKKFLSG